MDKETYEALRRVAFYLGAHLNEVPEDRRTELYEDVQRVIVWTDNNKLTS